MKKNLLVCVMALAAVFAVTGCNKNNNNGGETTTTQPAEKKLNCTLSSDSEYSTSKDQTTVMLAYEGDNVKTASYRVSKHMKDEKTAKSEYEDFTKNELPEVQAYKGCRVNASVSSNLVSATFTFTIAEMDDNAKALYEEYFDEIKDKNYDDVNKTLTDAGFKCN